MNLTDTPKQTDEISLKELILKIGRWWHYLLYKWKVILATSIVGGAIGLMFSYFSAPIYKAELSFALEDDKSGNGLGGAIGLASQFGFDLGGNGGGAFSGDNLLELMKSRSMVEKTLLTSVDINGKQQTLAELYIIFNKLDEKWRDNPELQNIHFLPNVNRSTFSLKQDSILGIFYNKITKENLFVDKIDKKLSIITIAVNSENELFSKWFAEVLAKTVSDFYINTKIKKSAQNLAILETQTDSIRNQLNLAIAGVASFSDNNPNANPALQRLRVPSQRRQVDIQANQAILSELVKNLELSKISLRKETPLIQIIDKPILPLEKKKTGKIKAMMTGIIIAGFFAVIILSISRFFKSLMA